MKKTAISLFLSFNFCFAGSIQSWSDGLINASSESPGYFRSQTRGYYTLGSQTLRINGQGTFSLAHIEMPKLSMGCGGIDAIWGGFSFLTDPKYLVAKLKAIGYAAAAYSFKQAINSLCKDCGEIMDSLENVSNAVNNFNLDTCAIGQGLPDIAESFFTDARQSNLESGQGNNPIAEREKSTSNTYADYINTVAAKINGVGGTINDAKKLVEDKAGLGSFLVEAIRKNDKTGTYVQELFGTDGETGEGKMLGVIRYLIGDAVGYQTIAGDEFTTKYEQIHPGIDVDKVMKALIYGDNIPYKTLKLDDDNRYIIRSKAKQFIFDDGLYGLYREKLKTIVNKMTAYQTISPADREFIQMQPIPIYKMLNVVAVQGNEELLNQVAEQLALRQSIAILNHILWVGGTDLAAELQSTTPDLMSENIKDKKQVLYNIQHVKILMQKEMETKMKSFNQNVLLMDKIRDYERQIKSQSQSELLQMMGTFN